MDSRDAATTDKNRPNRIYFGIRVGGLLLFGLVIFAAWIWVVRFDAVPRDSNHAPRGSAGRMAVEKVLSHPIANRADAELFPRNGGTSNVSNGSSGAVLTRTQALEDGSYEAGNWGFALSVEEARWMDRQGMPAPSARWRAYREMSLEQLMRLAKSGDTMAALSGALQSRQLMWNQDIGLEIEKLSRRTTGPKGEQGSLIDADEKRLELLMESLFQTKEWSLMHEFLWQGVIHGSSYAAAEMRRVYWDPAINCYKPYLCEGWNLIAWRMGNWDVTPVAGSVSRRYRGTQLSIGMVLRSADQIWNSIAVARARMGLGPLQLDLRPNQEKWQDWETHPDRPVRIIRRQ